MNGIRVGIEKRTKSIKTQKSNEPEKPHIRRIRRCFFRLKIRWERFHSLVDCNTCNKTTSAKSNNSRIHFNTKTTVLFRKKLCFVISAEKRINKRKAKEQTYPMQNCSIVSRLLLLLLFSCFSRRLSTARRAWTCRNAFSARELCTKKHSIHNPQSNINGSGGRAFPFSTSQSFARPKNGAKRCKNCIPNETIIVLFQLR